MISKNVLQRMRAMSPLEIPWRFWRLARGRLGQHRAWPAASEMDLAAVWRGPCTAEALRTRGGADFPPCPSSNALADWPPQWRDDCLRECQEILAHRVSIFGLPPIALGESIDWHRDPISDRRAPLTYSARMNYHDAQRVGDVKITWEISRMQHLTRLAQAWRWSGEERYPREIISQIRSWITENPWMRGLHWTSAMECALRLISWTWAFHWIRDWRGLEDDFCRLLVRAIAQHLTFIDRHYSLFSSANNHLLAEASGTYLAAAYWSGLRGAAAWKARARRILERECLRQNNEDGGNGEHAFYYQFFIWELLLFPAMAARAGGEDFSPAYWDRLRAMADFMHAVSDGAGNTPHLGDQDDGVAARLSAPADQPVLDLWALRQALWGGRDEAPEDAPRNEKVAWLCGRVGRRDEYDGERQSRLFPQSGYVCLHHGSGDRELFLLLDVAPLGAPGTGVHGHADALSLALHLGGRPMLVDPGTYSYQDTPWRRHFRSTLQHNTLAFGEESQGEYLNRFMWGKRPAVELVEYDLGEDGGTIAGRVTWWTGAVHERRLECRFAEQRLLLTDSWRGPGPVRMVFCCAPGVQVAIDGEECSLTCAGGGLQIHADRARMGMEEASVSEKCYALQRTQRIVLTGMGEVGSNTTEIHYSFASPD